MAGLTARQRREALSGLVGAEPAGSTSRPLSGTEARERARRRFREARGLTVAEYEALLARCGNKGEIVRRDSMTAKVQRVGSSKRDAPASDGRSMTGYVTTWGSTYRISSVFEGEFDETVLAGSFIDSLTERTPLVQWNHGGDSRVGSVPIASVTSIREDRIGLKLDAQLYDNGVVRPIRQAIQGRSVTGMSFQFQVESDEWVTRGGLPDLRRIKKVRLFECGPVAWPANAASSVGVRTAVRGLTPGQRRELLTDILR